MNPWAIGDRSPAATAGWSWGRQGPRRAPGLRQPKPAGPRHYSGRKSGYREAGITGLRDLAVGFNLTDTDSLGGKGWKEEILWTEGQPPVGSVGGKHTGLCWQSLELSLAQEWSVHRVSPIPHSAWTWLIQLLASAGTSLGLCTRSALNSPATPAWPHVPALIPNPLSSPLPALSDQDPQI